MALDTELNTATTKVDFSGEDLYFSFLAGASKIFAHQQELNKLNVFPVPDADTGTNLASTMRTVIDRLKPGKTYSQTVTHIAEAALEGARGNSGVIFAQFLYGISVGAQNYERISLVAFIDSLKKSVKYIYEALTEPVEGTMITVISEWVDHVYANRHQLQSFSDLLQDSFSVAVEALNATRCKLKVLANANVVDAGGRGFVLFLEGILEWMKSGDIRTLLKENHQARIPLPIEQVSHSSFSYRYCTEAILKGSNLSAETLRREVEDMGDSLVIAGSKALLRLHIHTDNPGQLFGKLSKFGKLTFQKAEDMKKQYDTVHQRKYSIALVTDSVCDLSPELFEHYQIHMVPMNIFIGEDQYLDKVTLAPGRFYDLTDASESFPTSAQPNGKAFMNLYAQLATNYDSIIAVHLTAKFSGTYQSSLRAAQSVASEFGKPVDVIDSQHLSGSQGLLVWRIAKAIEAGLSHQEIVQMAHRLRERLRILVSVRDLRYMVRGGRVSPMKERVARWLNLKPIVAMDEHGNSIVFGKAFSQQGNMRKVLKYIKQDLADKKIKDYIILHADNEAGAQWFKGEMQQLTGNTPVSEVNISPVVGLNAGRGAVAVAYLLEN